MKKISLLAMLLGEEGGGEKVAYNTSEALRY
jgi:hypothetical protein